MEFEFAILLTLVLSSLLGSDFRSRLGELFLFCLAARPVAKQMPSLNLRLVRLRRFSPLKCRWQLKHSGLLSLEKQSQKNDLAVREFQGVVVSPGDALIDLAEDRGLVLDSAAVPRPQTYPFNLVCEGQLCAGQ